MMRIQVTIMAMITTRAMAAIINTKGDIGRASAITMNPKKGC
ncbi:hypothetical protein KSB_24280 [Ktedonobacter robiniae]|uniref:Uncharacterized protein n=1 Tax=Ktedonobacter robiniae TaxID=2778365 RepID=A0ABQ3UMM7_9CHLR|nr:hypothetical protein KSB_24280 [Ktedonobacter robiniae]